MSTRGSSAEGRQAERGFTLVELVVATLVLLVAVMIAADLLGESGRLLHHSARRARDPWPAFVAERLRNDLRDAVPSGPTIHWESSSLSLATSDGLVVWSRSPQGELSRTSGPEAPFVLLRGVRNFSWRGPGGGALEVRISYETSSSYLRQLPGGLPRGDPGEEREIHLLVVGRGGGSEHW